jgi:flagellar motor protein MotB
MGEEEECSCEEGAPVWMATFSDMATLMLCFFVLLLSFANMDVENFRTALGSVREAFGVQFKVNGRFESLSDSPISLSNVQSTDVLHRERPIEREAIGLVREFLAARGLDGSS